MSESGYMFEPAAPGKASLLSRAAGLPARAPKIASAIILVLVIVILAQAFKSGAIRVPFVKRKPQKKRGSDDSDSEDEDEDEDDGQTKRLIQSINDS